MINNFTNLKEFSVSEISLSIKKHIENEFTLVKVIGELGRISKPSSGHIYFDMKDERSSLSCVVWRNTLKDQEEFLEEGSEVIALGRITTFSGQSRYQLVVQDVFPSGAGSLMALFQKRKQTFLNEGLFDQSRKKPIPYLPEIIGVITSESGAVFQDILHRLKERFPRTVILWSVPVQGEESARRVAEAIVGFNSFEFQKQDKRPDLLIVARGGGSLEDLWGFNEEIVIRAVANSKIPIISAIGHETDTTLIDYVADKRAPTPTAAAEMAVPEKIQLSEQIKNLCLRLDRSIDTKIEWEKQKLSSFAKSINNITLILSDFNQRFDILMIKFPNILLSYLQRKRENLFKLNLSMIENNNLLKDIRFRKDGLVKIEKSINLLFKNVLDTKKNYIDNLYKIYSALSYKRTLARGYSIIRDKKMNLVTSKTSAIKAHELSIEFSEDTIEVEVKSNK